MASSPEPGPAASLRAPLILAFPLAERLARRLEDFLTRLPLLSRLLHPRLAPPRRWGAPLERGPWARAEIFWWRRRNPLRAMLARRWPGGTAGARSRGVPTEAAGQPGQATPPLGFERESPASAWSAPAPGEVGAQPLLAPRAGRREGAPARQRPRLAQDPLTLAPSPWARGLPSQGSGPEQGRTPSASGDQGERGFIAKRAGLADEELTITRGGQAAGEAQASYARDAANADPAAEEQRGLAAAVAHLWRLAQRALWRAEHPPAAPSAGQSARAQLATTRGSDAGDDSAPGGAGSQPMGAGQGLRHPTAASAPAGTEPFMGASGGAAPEPEGDDVATSPPAP